MFINVQKKFDVKQLFAEIKNISLDVSCFMISYFYIGITYS